MTCPARYFASDLSGKVCGAVGCRAYTRERLTRGWEEPLDLETIVAAFHFYPWFYYEPGVVYIEHGGQYESSSHFPIFFMRLILINLIGTGYHGGVCASREEIILGI